jgi:hypothetical protein
MSDVSYCYWGNHCANTTENHKAQYSHKAYCRMIGLCRDNDNHCNNVNCPFLHSRIDYEDSGYYLNYNNTDYYWNKPEEGIKYYTIKYKTYDRGFKMSNNEIRKLKYEYMMYWGEIDKRLSNEVVLLSIDSLKSIQDRLRSLLIKAQDDNNKLNSVYQDLLKYNS